MPNRSLLELADALVAAAARILKTAKNEEELKIGFEKALSRVLENLATAARPRYERFGGDKTTVYRGRPDAVHGQVIIEYEPPRAFASQSGVRRAFNQLTEYLKAQSQTFDPTALLGVGFDGARIFFVKCQTGPSSTTIRFLQEGPYPFRVEAARTLLAHLRALARSPLTAENLAAAFGPASQIAPAAISAFCDAFEHWGSERVRMFFDEWRRLFGIVYGERFGTHRPEEGEALADLYGAPKGLSFQQLLFSVHTFFALLMKLIAAEILMLKETAFGSSFSAGLAHASKEQLKHALEDIEEGGVYAKQGISNFLEGDFFRWYLDAFSPRLEEAVRETARALSEFEPATTLIRPEATRDLLKRLYQYLVPQQIRHNLGEFYTPDWLAELLLEQVGYRGDTRKRLLDPACGSGTFLVLAIQKARQYALAHKHPPLQTAKGILANIRGFDLNPLAVIAARTNYVFALGDLLEPLESVEIPVYLADAVLWPKRGGQEFLNFEGGDYARVKTSVGEFRVPSFWLAEGGRLMRRAAPVVEHAAKHGYSIAQALQRFKKEGVLFPPHEKVVADFYEHILELESQGKNSIWARFLKNAAAPMMAGRFDFVVGNPPWIRWGYLSKEYREATLPLWKQYGLFSLKGAAARLGGGEKDFSMLFTYVAADSYLAQGGKLGFVITQEVLKSKGAGQGFRRFEISKGEKTKDVPLKVLSAHDLVTVQPFEGASNKTAMIILKRGQETQYPVPYIVWQRKKGVGAVPTNLHLQTAKRLLRRTKLLAKPVDNRTGSWMTYSPDSERLQAIRGENAYQAKLGARAEPYGVYWLEVLRVMADGRLLVRNLTERGKRKIRQVEEVIEADRVFPAVRGADIRRWCATPGIYVLLVQDPERREPYPEDEMKKNWPSTYDYLVRFKDVLLTRGSRTVREFAERTAFYAMFGIGPYTVAPYKVVWKRMANDIVAAVISQHKTPFGHKTVIPTDTTALIATRHEHEAHFLCGVINSSPVREFIRSYSSAGRGFGAPSVMNHVAIPKFDPKNALHKEIAACAARLQTLAQENAAEELAKGEKQNDNLAVKILGL